MKKIFKAFSQKQIPYRCSSSGVGVFSFSGRSVCGSMTIEAALALPIFIFFMVSILYVLQIISAQAESYQELHQRGNEIAMTAYQDRHRYSEGIVSLTETYHIKPLLLWQDFGNLRVVQEYYGYAWIGYDLGSREVESTEAGEEYVYITETGTVYHRTMSCSYLDLSVRSVLAGDVSSLRNSGGARYYQCELCSASETTVLFITSYGTRYHSDVNCSGLKRTVETLLLREAVRRGYRACSRCG
jgi:hypothetical protein